MTRKITALTAVIAWRLFGPRPLGAVPGAILFAAWLLPLGAIYLSVNGVSVAPLVMIGVFAIAVRDAIADNRIVPRWNPFRAAPAGPSAAPSH